MPAAVAAILVLAACGGDDDTTTDSEGDTSSLSTATVDAVGTVLVDADGMPVYTNEAEASGTIECVDACLDFWPAVEVGDGVPESVEGVDGTFGTTSRPDGTEQVTLDDQPLYTFVQDEGADAAKGDGFEDDFQGNHFVWHVVTADASSTDDSDDDDGGGGYGGY